MIRAPKLPVPKKKKSHQNFFPFNKKSHFIFITFVQLQLETSMTYSNLSKAICQTIRICIRLSCNAGLFHW